MRFGRSLTVPPTNLLREVRVLNVAFRGYQQQDAQEFLRFFLDRLHEDLRQAVPTRVESGAAAATAAAGGAATNGVPAPTAAISGTTPNGPAVATATTSSSGGSGSTRHRPFGFGGKKKKSKAGRGAEATAEQAGPMDATTGAFSVANGGSSVVAVEDGEGDDDIFVSRRPRGVPNRKGEPQASVISDTFAGVLESHVVCRHCEKVRRPPPLHESIREPFV